jgi:hypothetical protein
MPMGKASEHGPNFTAWFAWEGAEVCSLLDILDKLHHGR